MQIFSERHGFKPDCEPEITIRNDAPQELRDVVLLLADNVGFEPSDLRKILCSCLLKAPNPSNWGEDYIKNENRILLGNTVWYKVYDFIEAISNELLNTYRADNYNQFEAKLNGYLIENGIGWKLNQGQLSTRNPEALEQTVKLAVSSLESSEMPTAKQELHEALKDLSKRPEPDITGAIQHSMAALECVMREVTGNSKATLGALISKHSGFIPVPLDTALTKLWGFASEYGRHIQEGKEPKFTEAQLVVGCCASLITYLTSTANSPAT